MKKSIEEVVYMDLLRVFPGAGSFDISKEKDVLMLSETYMMLWNFTAGICYALNMVPDATNHSNEKPNA